MEPMSKSVTTQGLTRHSFIYDPFGLWHIWCLEDPRTILLNQKKTFSSWHKVIFGAGSMFGLNRPQHPQKLKTNIRCSVLWYKSMKWTEKTEKHFNGMWSFSPDLFLKQWIECLVNFHGYELFISKQDICNCLWFIGHSPSNDERCQKEISR